MVTDSHEQAVIDAVPKKLFVAGEWRPAASGKSFAVEDPATGESMCEVADGDSTMRLPRSRRRHLRRTAGRRIPLANAARSCAAPTSCSRSGPTTSRC